MLRSSPNTFFLQTACEQQRSHYLLFFWICQSRQYLYPLCICNYYGEIAKTIHFLKFKFLRWYHTKYIMEICCTSEAKLWMVENFAVRICTCKSEPDQIVSGSRYIQLPFFVKNKKLILATFLESWILYLLATYCPILEIS